MPITSGVEQIDLSFLVLDDMERFLAERRVPAEAGVVPDRGERIVIAQILENAYTAVETALLRISQGFVPACSPTSPTACFRCCVDAFRS
jgi:hypothetical protein